MTTKAKPYLLYAVDDDPTVSVVLKAFLSDYAQCHFFADVERLIDKIHHIKPDVILADVNMPKMSGLALKERFQDIPVVLLTGDRAIVAQYDLAIPKPFKKEALLRILDKAVGEKV